MRSLALLALVSVSLTAQDPVRGARHPALSPDGQTLAFSWRGDLWKVPAGGGAATRLTVHPGDDRAPQWSPDGRWIAFSGNRDGNYDVFVIAADGGGTRQLTFHSAADLVTSWTPDGRHVLFTSARDFDRGVLWSVPVAGGTERKLTRGQVSSASLTPDGTTLLVATGAAGGWWRKGYRGSNNWAIWSRPVARQGGATQLTTFTGRNGWPQYSADGRTIYFLSDSTGTTQLWRMAADGSGKQAMTRLPEDGAGFLAVARNAPLAAFEFLADLWTVSLTAGEPRRVAVTASTDEQFNRVSRQVMSDNASALEVSVDGRDVAFVVRGELFAMPARNGAGPAENLTQTAGREQMVSWSPDGRALMYVSDRSGNEDLWLVRSADSAEPRLSRTLRTTHTQLTREPTRELNPMWSPDGRQIAFIRQGDPPALWLMDADGRNQRKLLDGYIGGVQWSPDGRYLAFTMQLRGTVGRVTTDIFIMPSAGGTPVNVTRYPTTNRGPRWSPDGRRLAFISNRGADPGASGGAPISELYHIWLRQADAEKTREDWQMEDDAGPGRAAAGTRRDTARVQVQIDFAGIEDRAVQVTDGYRVGDYAISPDGRTYAFSATMTGQTDVWAIGRDGDNPVRLTRGTGGADMAFDGDGRRVFYRTQRGTIASVDLAGQAAASHGFQAQLTIDVAAENLQMFEESWRLLGNAFYDPRMHGRDWNALRERYRPWVEAAYTKEGLADVVLMLIGELNASHLNFALAAAPDAVRAGELGVVFDDAYRGRGLRVAHVTPGGPADRVASRVAVGEYILAIGNDEITETTNVHALLVNTPNERILLRVAATADGRNARLVAIRPVATNVLGDLLYEEWVARNHRWVDSASGGRIGYLHIRAMNQPSLERFKRDLWGREYDNPAVIIDQRYNGGGNIHEQLWTELLRRAPGYTTNRAGERRFSPPQWQRPTIVMQNQNSFSDAEIFPFGVRALGVGTTLGIPTGGGVIGTQNIQLIDGTTFRLPGSGWYAVADERNLENWGVEPEIHVENPFEEEQLGRDAQLIRAVQELLRRI
ncbi:MAG: S41 family peptidase [Gemmatimonadales bacterium]